MAILEEGSRLNSMAENGEPTVHRLRMMPPQRMTHEHG
jgi:hypothetical protein